MWGLEHMHLPQSRTFSKWLNDSYCDIIYKMRENKVYWWREKKMLKKVDEHAVTVILEELIFLKQY